MAFFCVHAVKQVMAMLHPDGITSRILKERGHTKYHMEYSGFLTNHLAHGVLALQALGATDEQIRDWADNYCLQLEPPVEDTLTDPIDDEVWEAYLGQRKSYVPLCEFFEKQLHTTLFHTKRGVIGRYAERLMDGLAGGAFHGLIHLGFGILHYENTTHTNLLAEGLAYFAFEYHSLGPVVPTHTSPSLSTMTILEVLAAMRDEPRFQEIIDANKGRPEYAHLGGGFQNSLYALADHGEDLVQSYLERMALYRYLTEPDGVRETAVDINAAARTIFRTLAVDVYAKTTGQQANDFFLLHGVTSCWALRKVLPYLPNDEARRMALVYFLKAVVGTYAAQGMPALHKAPVASGEGAGSNGGVGGTMGSGVSADTEMPMAWSTLADAACSDPTLDEHFIKLVFVLREESNGAEVDQGLDESLRAAAAIPLTHPYRFGRET